MNPTLDERGELHYSPLETPMLKYPLQTAGIQNEGNPMERAVTAGRTGHALLREKRIARPRIDGSSLALALQHVQLSLDLAPLVGVRRRRFALVDDGPRLR